MYFCPTPKHTSDSKKGNFRKAFTLVELLISVGIMLLVAGAIIPNFNNYLKNQSLIQSQEQFKNDLRNLQNKAINGDSSTEFIGSSPVQFWGLRFQPYVAGSLQSFDYFTAAFATRAACDAYTSTKKGSITLPDKMRITSPPSSDNTCIFFDMNDGSIKVVRSSTVYVCSNSAPCVVTVSDGTLTKNTTLYNSGLVF